MKQNCKMFYKIQVIKYNLSPPLYLICFQEWNMRNLFDSQFKFQSQNVSKIQISI